MTPYTFPALARGSGPAPVLPAPVSPALAETGLGWQHGVFAAGLAYTDEYGAQQEVHTGWLTMKFEF